MINICLFPVRNTNGNFATHFTVGGEGPSGTLGIIDTETEEVVKLIEIEDMAPV